jgi:hypothetical protein
MDDGIREMLLATVGGFERFERTFDQRTFSPKRLAEQAIADAHNSLEAAVAELNDAGISPDLQREWLASAIRKWAAYQHAGARTMNWMITGPARFPVEQNRKRMDTEMKRMNEYMAFVTGAGEWAHRRLRIAKRKEVVAADAASGVEHKEKVVDGVRIVLNKALDRVQIIFPDKPSDSERAILKSNAFRWAPSVGAWQRQLTQNGVWAAESALKQIGEAA